MLVAIKIEKDKYSRNTYKDESNKNKEIRAGKADKNSTSMILSS
jgi:hypothetical protein